MPSLFRDVSIAAVLAAAVAAASCGRVDSNSQAAPRPVSLQPVVTTDAVTDDADDPAIWVHPTDPARSLILGTNKVAAPAGAVVVFGLDGRTRQTIAGIDRPNNIDVEYGVTLGGRTIDVAVVTERLAHQLRVFEIEPAEGRLVGRAQVPVLDGEAGERAEPMGIALYKRPSDAALFAIVAPKTGAATGYLAQYRLASDGAGQIAGTLVRRFGHFSDVRNAEGELGEIEAVVVDDTLGYVYYADELYGLRKWHADPDHPDAATELATFGTSGYLADREGLAIYTTGPDTGYLVSTDQIEGGSILRFYAREGAPGAPHDHRWLFDVPTPSDATDGLDVTSQPLPGFDRGLAVMMNSRGRNFFLFNWADLQP